MVLVVNDRNDDARIFIRDVEDGLANSEDGCWGAHGFRSD
jgi:hypothetical protein